MAGDEALRNERRALGRAKSPIRSTLSVEERLQRRRSSFVAYFNARISVRRKALQRSALAAGSRDRRRGRRGATHFLGEALGRIARDRNPRRGCRLETVLQQDTRRVVGTLPGTAGHEDLAVTRQFAKTGRSWPIGMLIALVPSRRPARLVAHVEEEFAIHGFPVASGMSPRSTSAATIPAKLSGSSRAELRRIAKFGLLRVVMVAPISIAIARALIRRSTLSSPRACAQGGVRSTFGSRPLS